MMTTAEIAVAGAGPAGAVIALQLARLGHRVVLIASRSSSRRHSSESLTPGVAEQLAFIDARDVLDASRPRPTSEIELRWHSGRYERRPEMKAGYLVDRSRFDAELVATAGRTGVDILAADVRSAERHAAGWRLECDSGDGPLALSSRLLVDAAGRHGLLPKRGRRRGHRLLAISGRWRGAGVPSSIRLASSARCWAWGAPTAADAYEATVFLDPRDLEAGGRSIERRYRTLVDACELLDRAGAADLLGPVGACDATPYVDLDAVGADFIKIGDAALAVDPLSSAGVQVAIQSGVAGAIAVHTLLSDGEDGLVAEFWANELTRRSRQHAAWSAEFYRAAAERFASSFWRSRSAIAQPNAQPAPRLEQKALPAPAQALRLSRSLGFTDAPCIVGCKVESRAVVTHPASSDPVAFLGETDLPVLLRQIRPGMSAAAVLHSWMRHVDPTRAITILSWTWQRGLIKAAPPDPAS